MTADDPFTFAQIFESEIRTINKRRSAAPVRQSIVLETDPEPRRNGEEALRPNEEAELVGLALSGGGVRSAAFALGVLQALEETDVLQRCDYLSTVSGGGYIGSSLSAALQSSRGKFPFKSKLAQDETPSLRPPIPAGGP